MLLCKTGHIVVSTQKVHILDRKDGWFVQGLKETVCSMSTWRISLNGIRTKTPLVCCLQYKPTTTSLPQHFHDIFISSAQEVEITTWWKHFIFRGNFTCGAFWTGGSKHVLILQGNCPQFGFHSLWGMAPLWEKCGGIPSCHHKLSHIDEELTIFNNTKTSHCFVSTRYTVASKKLIFITYHNPQQ